MISVVIPAYNEEKYIGLCLQSLMDHPPSCPHEIIVVDNASTDGTARVARRFPGVRVVSEKRKGLAHARQRGLDSMRGTLYAALDADTIVGPRWAEILQREFDRDPSLVCLSGPYYLYDLPVAKAMTLWLLARIVQPIATLIVGPIVTGGNFVARKDALLEAGCFDTSIPFYGEDVNTARRLRTVGTMKYSFKFRVNSSGRRIAQQGVVATIIVYWTNHLSQSFFGKTVTREYADLR